MNEEIIFKWDGENDRESVGKCRKYNFSNSFSSIEFSQIH